MPGRPLLVALLTVCRRGELIHVYDEGAAPEHLAREAPCWMTLAVPEEADQLGQA